MLNSVENVEQGILFLNMSEKFSSGVLLFLLLCTSQFKETNLVYVQ